MLCSDWTDAYGDLSPHWVHRSFCLFVVIRLKCFELLRGILKVIYKGCFKSFVALYADRICSDQHFVENRIEKFLFV